jgi:hypothetical protein
MFMKKDFHSPLPTVNMAARLVAGDWGVKSPDCGKMA